MPRCGRRKLVDIGGNGERLERALQNFLVTHQIEYDRHEFDGFVRYLVPSRDLGCAQSVLPAIQQLAEGGAE